MKKKVLSIVLCSAMVGSLTACGGGSAETDTNAKAADASAADGNTLSVYAWDTSFNIPALKAAEADYQANVNPDFKLEIIEQSASGDVETAITTAASAGNFETLPDIVLFQDRYIKSYVANYPDAWQDLNDIDIKWDDFSAAKVAYSTIDGVHYGVPVDNGTVICAYRTDLLEAAGYTIDDMTGITWEKFIEVGEKVYAETGKYLMCMNGDGNDMVPMMGQAEGVSMFKDGVPYITENETLVQIVDIVCEMVEKKVLYLANSWSDYTDQAIQGDMVAGVMNGNWIIPTIKKVEANSGKWAITSMPTINGGEGYASSGGCSLYITSNCANAELAKDFLAKTFGSSTVTYDGALLDGGVVTTYAPAGVSEVYNQPVPFFNDQAIYADIVEMGTHVQIIEESDYHYSCRDYISTAIINVVQNGYKLEDALKEAEDNLKFEMGL